MLLRTLRTKKAIEEYENMLKLLTEDHEMSTINFSRGRHSQILATSILDSPESISPCIFHCKFQKGDLLPLFEIEYVI